MQKIPANLQQARLTTSGQSLPMDLQRQLAVISGGSRGLGFEVAQALGSQGFDLALIAKDKNRLDEAAKKLSNLFPNITVTPYAVDLADMSATRETAQRISSELATPNVLVLAHGVMSEKMSKTLRTTDEEWRRVLSINLDSVFTITNAIAPAMAEARNGRIIVFSACLGRMSGPGNAGGLAPYRISKAGVNAFVRNLAHETGLGARGLLVDAVCPNHTQTDMGGPDAPRTVAEGAECAIWLATRDFQPGDTTGVLWEDRNIVPW